MWPESYKREEDFIATRRAMVKRFSVRGAQRTRRDFIARSTCDGEALLSPQADHFTGAKWKEKASACFVRNDGWGAKSAGPKCGATIYGGRAERKQCRAKARRYEMTVLGCAAGGEKTGVLEFWGYDKAKEGHGYECNGKECDGRECRAKECGGAGMFGVREEV